MFGALFTKCTIHLRIRSTCLKTIEAIISQLSCERKDRRTWMTTDVLNYLCTNFEKRRAKAFRYSSSWTECLRLIRNIDQHNNDRPRILSQPSAFSDPQEYFREIFRNLPIEVHRIARSCDWKYRTDFKEYFTEGIVDMHMQQIQYAANIYACHLFRYIICFNKFFAKQSLVDLKIEHSFCYYSNSKQLYM